MSQNDQITAAYLGCCNAHKWETTAEGLAAFRRDVIRGFRDERGVIQWPERSYISPEARRLCSLWQQARRS